MSIITDDDLLGVVMAFGEDVVLWPDRRNLKLTGIYERGFVDLDDGIGSINSSVPSVQMRTADIDGLTFGDGVYARNTYFTVRQIDDDGFGMSKVILHED